MKIQKKEIRTVPLMNLTTGDVFEYRDYLYMIVSFAEVIDCPICGEEIDENHCYSIGAVELESGDIYSFNSTDEVFKINGKFVEE